MRVLLVSDMAHTGFGRVGRELATGLLARGHDIRIIGINYRGVSDEIDARMRKAPQDPVGPRLRKATDTLLADPLLEIMVPAGLHGHGLGLNLTAPAIHGNLWKAWKPEGMVIVADPQALKDRLTHDQGAIGHLVAQGCPVLNYVPIEGEPLPVEYRRLWQGVTPVALSKYGQGLLERLLGRPVPLAYHGVAPDFRPVSPGDPCLGHTSKDTAKAAIGLAGRTIILRNDRHILRKNYGAFFRSMAPVLANHPDVTLMVHCSLTDEYGDMRELISTMPGAVDHGLGVWDHPQVHLTMAHDTFTGVTDEEMRLMYNAADLYVSPTMAEGFGLCLAESLACGTPVVATDYSAIPEVVGPGGALIPPLGYMTSPYALRWALVDEAAMSAAVERLVSKPALRRELGAAGRRHVAQFTWDSALNVFEGLLQPAAVAA